MMSDYKNKMDQIMASDTFKARTLHRLEQERRYQMNNTKKIIIGLAACAVLTLSMVGYNMSEPQIQVAEIDFTERIKVDSNAPAACVAANIEGVIVEISDDGMSIKLDNGKWVKIDDNTEFGTTLPTSAAIEDQLIEPTFRVGNSIAGFTLDENRSKVLAYAIYINWNWDDPIK